MRTRNKRMAQPLGGQFIRNLNQSILVAMPITHDDGFLQLIEKLHGVTYSEGHVWKLMTAWGWSAQKPEKQSNRRNDKAILEWKQVDWERIKKRAG